LSIDFPFRPGGMNAGRLTTGNLDGPARKLARGCGGPSDNGKVFDGAIVGVDEEDDIMGLDGAVGLLVVVVVDDEPVAGGNRELNHSSTTSEASPLKQGINSTGSIWLKLCGHVLMILVLTYQQPYQVSSIPSLPRPRPRPLPH